MTGWECPGCGRCYAPSVAECRVCGNGVSIGTTEITIGSPYVRQCHCNRNRVGSTTAPHPYIPGICDDLTVTWGVQS